MLVYGRAPAICGVFVPKPDLERKWRISHKQPLKHKCRKRQKTIGNNYGGFIKAELFVVNAGLIETGLFYCCLRGQSCLMF